MHLRCWFIVGCAVISRSINGRKVITNVLVVLGDSRKGESRWTNETEEDEFSARGCSRRMRQ